MPRVAILGEAVDQEHRGPGGAADGVLADQLQRDLAGDLPALLDQVDVVGPIGALADLFGRDSLGLRGLRGFLAGLRDRQLEPRRAAATSATFSAFPM